MDTVFQKPYAVPINVKDGAKFVAGFRTSDEIVDHRFGSTHVRV